MKTKGISSIVFLFILMGLILRVTPVASYFHELLHVTFCNIDGITSNIIAYNMTEIGRYTVANIYGPYFVEFLLYSLLFIGLFRSRKTVSGLFLGMLTMVFIRAYLSLDFNITGLEVLKPKAVEDILNRWLLFGGSVLVFCYYRLLRVVISDYNDKVVDNPLNCPGV